MKKWYWYLPKLTPVQVEKLKEGLMSSFRIGHYINGFYSAAEIGSWQVI
jgi:hypothetical protein